MAEQKAAGILAVGAAEAEAIERKALAMKKMEEAAILELILNSNVLPNMIRAAAEPIGDAFTKIGSITMYGEGNNAKLAEEINTITSQVTQSIQQSLGLDLKSVIAGYFGGKIIDKKETKETE
jgi:flotillin